MVGLYELTILICTALPGIPQECAEAYVARHPVTREIVRFEQKNECVTAGQTHAHALNFALRSASQPKVIFARGKCWEVAE